MDSAMFNQEPPSGVYNGIIPCDINQQTNAAFLWPLKLYFTRL
jgi:hypothetical protein